MHGKFTARQFIAEVIHCSESSPQIFLQKQFAVKIFYYKIVHRSWAGHLTKFAIASVQFKRFPIKQFTENYSPPTVHRNDKIHIKPLSSKQFTAERSP
jgi:hypothetical protein